MSDTAAREMTGLELLLSRFRSFMVRLRRKLPYIVWYGDELDVRVTFSRERLKQDGTIDEAFRALHYSGLSQVERAMGDMGIKFDRGIGCEGRDWEWDWSLDGPISVVFRGRASRPERRMERPRPTLVYSK